MTKVSVISAVTGQPVAEFDTKVDTLQKVTAKALTFREVRDAPFTARFAAEALLKSIFDGSFQFRGEFRDRELTQYGISHLVVTDSDANLPLVEDAEGSEWTPVAHPYFRETATVKSVSSDTRAAWESEGRNLMSSVKSTPADFKGNKLVDLKSIIVGAAALIVGAVAGGLIW